MMEGLTVAQAMDLQIVTSELWMLLDQDQYNEIMQIFKDAVKREIDNQKNVESEYVQG